MWEPRRLTTLWAFTACYRDSFTFTFTLHIEIISRPHSSGFIFHNLHRHIRMLRSETNGTSGGNTQTPAFSHDDMATWYGHRECWEWQLSCQLGGGGTPSLKSWQVLFLFFVHHPAHSHWYPTHGMEEDYLKLRNHSTCLLGLCSVHNGEVVSVCYSVRMFRAPHRRIIITFCTMTG
jgi:hypothetical protein